MHDHIKKVLTSQYEAALAMLNDCIQKCPSEHWDGIIGKYSFWMVAYHTLCMTDWYLTRDERAFVFRPIHPKGWSEFEEEYPSRRFEKGEISDYVLTCREKAVETLAAETAESLAGPSGHARYTFSRMELLIHNMRHIQHHTGQLSAYLRKVGADPVWVGSGWARG